MLLTTWLCRPSTVALLGIVCIEAIKTFQAKLMNKEKYLANYRRKSIPMGMDAMTTSPVESMNYVTKNKMNISPSMSISTALPIMLQMHTKRIKESTINAITQLQKTTLASVSSTRWDITKRSQHLIDQIYDARHRIKCVQEKEDEWICWYFRGEVDDQRLLDEEARINNNIGILNHHDDCSTTNSSTTKCCFTVPDFLQVHRVSTKKFGEELFLHCSCLLHHRCGIPCAHVFRILGQMRVSMVNVQHWKGFKAHYGSECGLGEAIGIAHAYHVKIAGRGVPVTVDMLTAAESINGTDDNTELPFLLHGTNYTDYEEAKFVMLSKDAVTVEDLMRHRSGEQFNDNGGVSMEMEDACAMLCGNVRGSLSQNAIQFQDHLSSSEMASDELFATESRMTDARKNIISAVDFILNNRHATLTTINDVERKIVLLKEEYANQLLDKIGLKPVGESMVWPNDSTQKGDGIRKERKRGIFG